MNTATRLLVLLVWLLGSFRWSPATAQTHSSGYPARVLILGSYHFANPGLDVAKSEVADVLTPAKQEEISRVVASLSQFKPTKILIERPPEWTGRLDSLYAEYRAGRHELERSEEQQLGFRLAAMFDHPRLYPIDYRNDFPFDQMMGYAAVHDTSFVSYVSSELGRITAESNRLQTENTVGEILQVLNGEHELAANHGIYLRFNRVGAGDTYVGSELLAKWYERNIRIVANIQSLAEPGDRIIVIFGAGHGPILRQLVASDLELELVDTRSYLPVR